MQCEICRRGTNGAIQGVIGRLIEIGKFRELENNLGKSEVMRISRQPSPLLIMTNQKHPENVQYFKYLQMMQKLLLKVNP